MLQSLIPQPDEIKIFGEKNTANEDGPREGKKKYPGNSNMATYRNNI